MTKEIYYYLQIKCLKCDGVSIKTSEHNWIDAMMGCHEKHFHWHQECLGCHYKWIVIENVGWD